MLIIFDQFEFLAIVTSPNRNQKAAAVVAAAIHAHAPEVYQSHTSAVIHVTQEIVHCPRVVAKTDTTQDPAHRKITAAPVVHQTEMKAWMIRLTMRRYVTTI